jgi:phospholipid transport system transporter-binding protein
VSQISVSLHQNIAVLQGELTRHTLTKISKKTVKSMLATSNVLIDLQQVNKVDTAGLAWLFYLLEQAQSAQCQLRFANLPSKLENLITLSGVNGFLPN